MNLFLMLKWFDAYNPWEFQKRKFRTSKITLSLLQTILLMISFVKNANKYMITTVIHENDMIWFH